MKQLFQYIFLWFAVLTLLGHAIIPHHHHAQANYSCELEKHDHQACTIHIDDADLEVCTHNDQTHSCQFHNHSIVKQTLKLYLATLDQQISPSQLQYFAILTFTYIQAAHKNLIKHHLPKRAPPVFA